MYKVRVTTYVVAKRWCYSLFEANGVAKDAKDSISTSTTSPSWSHDLGLWNAPTPAAVPVMTAVPAGIVVPGMGLSAGSVCYIRHPEKQMNNNVPTNLDSCG